MNEVNQIKTRRYPFLALSASMIMPGLGQLYNGEATKALLLFLGLSMTTPVSAWLILYGPSAAIWLIAPISSAIGIAIYLYSAVDAFRTAKRLGSDYIPQAFNQTYIYILILVLGYVFVFGQLAGYARQHWVESFRIPSKSMLPNIMQGDFLFTDKRVNCRGCKTQLQHGDLAILVGPNNRTILFLKRIIGLPGDQIEINGSIIKVNGQTIRGELVSDFGDSELDALLDDHIAYRENGANGSYTVIWRKDAIRQDHSFTVANGRVFVLGDNRDAARDSRLFGTVPLVDIIGKAKQIWFSKAADSIRWWRVGLNIDSNSIVNKGK